MSSALVYKSLEIVDPDFKESSGSKSKKVKNVFNLIPDNHKIIKKVQTKGRKSKKVEVLTAHRKLTVLEAKAAQKQKTRILNEQKKKLDKIRKACQIQLEKGLKKQIIERAVTKRPVKPKPKQKAQQKSVFTEEDFKKFEDEYFG